MPLFGVSIIPSTIPVILAGIEIFSSLYNVPHNEFLYGYNYDKSKAFNELFFPYKTFNFWHGGAITGLFAICLCSYSLSLFIKKKLNLINIFIFH